MQSTSIIPPPDFVCPNPPRREPKSGPSVQPIFTRISVQSRFEAPFFSSRRGGPGKEKNEEEKTNEKKTNDFA